EYPHDGAAHNALGVAVTVLGMAGGPISSDLAAAALEHFRRAVAADPLHLPARLSLVETLVGLDQKEEAIRQAWQALLRLGGGDCLPAHLLEAAHFPPAEDWFHLGWEQAAWDHAGDSVGEARAKGQLLRWRLHLLLADLTGELPHFY